MGYGSNLGKYLGQMNDCIEQNSTCIDDSDVGVRFLRSRGEKGE